MWSPNVYIKRYPVSLHFRSKWEVGAVSSGGSEC